MEKVVYLTVFRGEKRSKATNTLLKIFALITKIV